MPSPFKRAPDSLGPFFRLETFKPRRPSRWSKVGEALVVLWKGATVGAIVGCLIHLAERL